MIQTKDQSLTLVIPNFNEETAISTVIGKVQSAKSLLSEHGITLREIIVVDDGSQDQSIKILQLYQDITITKHEKNRGYGAALKTGFRQATSELICFLDMDATYDPEELVQLCEVLQDPHIKMSLGDRLSLITDMPFSRKVGNLLYVVTIYLIYGALLKDSCSGMRVFRKKDLHEFIDHTPDQLDFALAMSLICLRKKWPVVELPITYKKRIGNSKLNIFVDGFRFLFTIFKYRVER